MTKSVSLYLEDDAATQRLGKILAECRPDSAIIYLQGDLGAGKTTFSRGFVQTCGHKGVVKSPTYTLIEPYPLGTLTVYHLDLYRLADPEELEYLGLDMLTRSHTISLIEWPERGSNHLPAADLILSLEIRNSGRQATLTAHSTVAEQWLCTARSHLEQISQLSV